MTDKQKKIVIVSCTRKNEKDFYESTPLGISLNKLNKFPFKDVNWEFMIFFENSKGLGERYNEAIEEFIKSSNSVNAEDLLFLFAHDDVSIEDLFLKEKLNKAVEKYDIVGLAGTKYWELKSPAVWNNSPREQWTGAVAHTHDNQTWMTHFGVFGGALIVDGLFIAVKGETFKNTKIRFDPIFNFHFYDMDLCLQAYTLGLKVGTYPIWVTHSSIGDWRKDPKWHENEKIFIDKWKQS
jgi:GT2 family glycosyltransferase